MGKDRERKVRMKIKGGGIKEGKDKDIIRRAEKAKLPQ